MIHCIHARASEQQGYFSLMVSPWNVNTLSIVYSVISMLFAVHNRILLHIEVIPIAFIWWIEVCLL